MIFIFQRLRQTHLGLRAAHQQVKFAILLQQRHNFACATDMTVPCTLYGVKYLHANKCAGKLVKKNGFQTLTIDNYVMRFFICGAKAIDPLKFLVQLALIHIRFLLTHFAQYILLEIEFQFQY